MKVCFGPFRSVSVRSGPFRFPESPFRYSESPFRYSRKSVSVLCGPFRFQRVRFGTQRVRFGIHESPFRSVPVRFGPFRSVPVRFGPFRSVSVNRDTALFSRKATDQVLPTTGPSHSHPFQACHNFFVKKPKIFENLKSERAMSKDLAWFMWRIAYKSG